MTGKRGWNLDRIGGDPAGGGSDHDLQRRLSGMPKPKLRRRKDLSRRATAENGFRARVSGMLRGIACFRTYRCEHGIVLDRLGSSRGSGARLSVSARHRCRCRGQRTSRQSGHCNRPSVRAIVNPNSAIAENVPRRNVRRHGRRARDGRAYAGLCYKRSSKPVRMPGHADREGTCSRSTSSPFPTARSTAAVSPLSAARRHDVGERDR